MILVAVPALLAVTCAYTALLRRTKPGSTVIKIYVSEKLGAFKDLRGFNGGPLSPRGWDKLPSLNLTDRYLQLSVKVVRIHDYWNSDDLDVIFPDGLADPEAPSSYNFRPLD